VLVRSLWTVHPGGQKSAKPPPEAPGSHCRPTSGAVLRETIAAIEVISRMASSSARSRRGVRRATGRTQQKCASGVGALIGRTLIAELTHGRAGLFFENATHRLQSGELRIQSRLSGTGVCQSCWHSPDERASFVAGPFCKIREMQIGIEAAEERSVCP